jgi:hypothetical protein
MQNRIFSLGRIVALAMLILMATGCEIGGETPAPTFTPQPPVVNVIVNPNISDVRAGESVSLNVDASGQNLTFKWSVSRGTLSAADTPSVIYTPPDTSGVDTVTVEVSSASGTSIKSVSFNVIVPATDTPIPTDTPLPMATPVPPACDTRLTTRDLFPQIYQEFGVEGQFPTYGPIPGNAGSENFRCEVVSDLVHNAPAAVHIKYDKVADNSGWWGIATPNGYDASQHNQFCFWVYAKQPASFRVKMKDTSLKEAGDVVTIETANEWKQICTEITRFEELGVNTQQMDNVNLGFEAPWDSAEIWVADLEFK